MSGKKKTTVTQARTAVAKLARRKLLTLAKSTDLNTRVVLLAELYKLLGSLRDINFDEQ